MNTTLTDHDLARVLGALPAANRRFAAAFPGDGPARQPVHTVYGGAHLFRADTARRLGEAALGALREHAPDPETLALALGLDPGLATLVRERVMRKLETEPVEDFRIDFEDGYGNRPDEEEDAAAVAAAAEVARGHAGGTLPPFIGIRIKPLNEEQRGRALRTLDIFLTTLLEGTGVALPEGFVVTLPKVTIPDQAAALARAFEIFERRAGLPPRRLRFEIMVETPQSVIGHDGRVALPAIVAAGDGRVTAAHFGTYDYTAGCGITAAHQAMTHPPSSSTAARG